MPGTDPSSRCALLRRWQMSTLIIAGAGILAFVLWTLPNWEAFWGNVAQFPTLWQISPNRRIIIFLTIKVVSPLLIMGLVGTSLWLSCLLEAPQSQEGNDHVSSEHGQHQAPAGNDRDHSTSSSSARNQIQRTLDGPFPIQPAMRPGTGTSRHDPETPFPSPFPVSQALRGQAAGSGSVGGGQSASAANRIREENPVGASPSGAHPIQAAIPSQPLAFGGPHAASDPLISIRLLKDVSLMINVPGGGHVVVPLTLNAKRVQLLAYLAWRRGELIDRDKILEHVFGWGLADEEATEEKLSERFESHKKLLRKKIREVVVEHINKPAGRQILDLDHLDPFVSDSGFWGLSALCRVEDLEAIEAAHKVIARARKDGKLVDEIPEGVMEACERLIANYPGDFLESLLKKYPSEFRPWQGRSSWVRKPYTHYRDCYLEALWYGAEYEWRMGQHYSESDLGEVNLRKQQEYFGRAAQTYQSYAMYACNSKFDAKATFGAHGEYGERVGMSERALRRCVVLLGALSRTDLINQVWSAYITQMKSISDHRWQPSKETQADVQAAREQTSAYRFAAQISQMSDFAAKP